MPKAPEQNKQSHQLHLLPKPSQPPSKTFWEERLWREGIQWVAGLDEAGRGAWAGPVVAAAVVFKPFTYLPDIDDSKKIDPQKREALFEIIVREAVAYGVGIISNHDIDTINILQATLKAMREAVLKLEPKPEFLLIDGNRGIGLSIPQKTIVKGDALSLSVGAASILAKVTRDRLMTDLEKEFAHFKFSVHKGYGVSAHQEELRRFGVLPCHRRSYAPIKSLLR